MKKLPRILVSVLVLFGVLVALLVNLARNESFLRWAVQRAVESGRLPVSIDSLEGSLAGGEILLKAFAWERDGLEVFLEDVSISWRPSSFFLLNRTFDVTKLAVGSATIFLPDEGEDTPLPTAIALPVRLSIWEAEIGVIEIHRAGSIVSAREADFTFQAGRRGFLLRLARLDSDRGRISGWVRLAGQHPFALSGRLAFRGEYAGRPFSLRTDLGGDLTGLRVNVSGSGKTESLRASGIFDPLGEKPVRSLRVTLRGLDPGDYLPASPGADMVFSLEARSRDRRTYEGKVRLNNRSPGFPDRGRVPLHGLSFDFSGGVERFSVLGLAADLGPAGSLDGSGQWRDGAFRLLLSGRELDAGAFFPPGNTLPAPLKMAADLDVSWRPGRFFARGSLKEREGLFSAEFSVGEEMFSLERFEARYGSGEAAAHGEIRLGDDFPFRLAGSFSGLNPADFGEYPVALIHGRFESAGAVFPGWRAAVELLSVEGEWAGGTLAGRGRFDLDSDGVTGAEFGFRSGENEFTLEGALDRERISAAWEVNAPDAGFFHPSLAGAARARGTVNGSPRAPRVGFSATGRELSWRDGFRVGEADFSGVFLPGGKERWRLESVTATARTGTNRLRASGRASSSAVDVEWSFEGGDLAQIHPPLAGAARARGTVNGSPRTPRVGFSATGRELSWRDGFRAGEADFSGVFLPGGKERWRLESVTATARTGANRLRASGRASSSAVYVEWSFEGGDLAQIHPSLAGAARARGRADGRLTAPRLDFSCEGENISFREQHHAAALSGRLRLAGGLDGRIEAGLELREASFQERPVADFSLSAAGARGAHRLEAAASFEEYSLRLRLSGALEEGYRWRGTLDRLRLSGRHEGVLARPAAVTASRDDFLLSGFIFETDSGVFRIERLGRGDYGWETKGAGEGIPIALAEELTRRRFLPGNLESDLVFSLDWDLAAGTALDGFLNLSRDRGDVYLVRPGARKPLGLADLELSLDAQGSRVRAGLDFSGALLGTAKFDGRTVLSRDGNRWGIESDAPFSFSAKADVPSIAWLPFPGGGMYQADGAFALELSGEGTLENPDLRGALNGTGLELLIEEQGVLLRDGVLGAVFRGEQLVVERLFFKGREGELSARGAFGFRPDPEGEVTVALRGLEIISRPDRWLVASGEGRLGIQDGRIRLSGDISTDRGRVVISSRSRFALSRDIVMSGRREVEAPAVERVVPLLDMDVRIDTGNNFSLNANGLETLLRGRLTVSAENGREPRVSGTVNLVRGTYFVYGQRLDIERGVITFRGPIENPALDVIALRRHRQVEAGVRVSGTAQAPEITLVSYPDVPDMDKIAWLVLGRSAEDAGKTDVGVLLIAADALLSEDDAAGLQYQFAQLFGLEEIGVVTDENMADTIIRVGRRLSENIYLSYERSMTGFVNLVKIRYDMARRWSFHAVTGSEHGVGVFYTISFD